ncbi:hypothetical protein CDE51_00160 [Pasteurella multocida]|nr:hypothetical protein CDE51_00160 [Pasteurella multocida]
MMPNTLWAGDITYIPTEEGWLYLAVVIDWFSRLIVGWSVSDTPDSRLCIQALRLAIHRRKPPSEVIFSFRPRLTIQQPSLSTDIDGSENGA